MKVIIFKRPDGGCSIIHPSPEMFDPNSRTIRNLEQHDGIIFSPVKKIIDGCIAIARQMEVEVAEIRKSVPKRTFLNKAAHEKALAEAAKQETIIRRKFNSLLDLYGEDRHAYPDFDFQQFCKEAMDFIIKKDVPEGIEYRIAEQDELPTDRYFRNAWTDNGGMIDVDMTKAKEIHRCNIREHRVPLMRELDIQFMRALETDKAELKEQVVLLKQALRDATKDPAIEAAETPELLKAVWPACLGDKPQ